MAFLIFLIFSFKWGLNFVGLRIWLKNAHEASTKV